MLLAQASSALGERQLRAAVAELAIGAAEMLAAGLALQAETGAAIGQLHRQQAAGALHAARIQPGIGATAELQVAATIGLLRVQQRSHQAIRGEALRQLRMQTEQRTTGRVGLLAELADLLPGVAQQALRVRMQRLMGRHAETGDEALLHTLRDALQLG